MQTKLSILLAGSYGWRQYSNGVKVNYDYEQISATIRGFKSKEPFAVCAETYSELEAKVSEFVNA